MNPLYIVILLFMANIVIDDATKLEPEKLYRVSQVKGLFNQPHLVVQSLFKLNPEVKRGRKEKNPPEKSSRYFLTGAAIQRMLNEQKQK